MNKKQDLRQLPNDYWKDKLTPEQYRIAREKGTERAFTGEYYANKEQGAYACVCCGEELFRSETKFDSGSGWPSFWAPTEAARIDRHEDRAHSMVRVEILCAKCGSHLGHVFDDGPEPTGERYCVNSASLVFKKTS
jgi:peptide-methionine (R)-S-oxide reductase